MKDRIISKKSLKGIMDIAAGCSAYTNGFSVISLAIDLYDLQRGLGNYKHFVRIT